MNYFKKISSILISILLVSLSADKDVTAQENWVSYSPSEGNGNGRNIVLISGDQEYRSEEAVILLAKILSKGNGFNTTVLFPIDSVTGYVNPSIQDNIPGLDHLRKADLMLIFTRWQELPYNQMKYVDEYVRAGKPIVGLRTATHAFRYTDSNIFAKYSYDSKIEGWYGGFGKRIFGETWISHHGVNYIQGTRGFLNGAIEAKSLSVLRGIKSIWVSSGSYTSAPDNAEVLVWGAPTESMSSESMVDTLKNIMPLAWTRNYISEKGNSGRAFVTTMGAATDLKDPNLRRLIVNGCFWALNMEDQIPAKGANIDLIGDFKPSVSGISKYRRGLKPSDF